MAYFNHAFAKCFIATKQDQAEAGVPGEAGGAAAVSNGMVTTIGMHVSNLKSTAASEGWLLGPGVTGVFGVKGANKDLTLDIGLTPDCCPFYLASSSIKINDKQGPFHGGYQVSNKSKEINPKYIRKAWVQTANPASAAVMQLGGTPDNVGGQVLTVGTLVGGTGYPANVTGFEAATIILGGGSGATVNITTDAGGVITAATLNKPGYGYSAGDVLEIELGNGDGFITVVTASVITNCNKEFLCEETYYLRLEVKGADALRFANHNLYQNLGAYTGCCDDPLAPTPVDPKIVYLDWAQQIAGLPGSSQGSDQGNPYFKDFIRPIVVVDGISYAKDEASALESGLPIANIWANIPVGVATTAGLILLGAYVETTFGDCTFQPSDYYSVEPLKLYASEVDLNGDPCTFEGLCVVHTCLGNQANGLGESVARDVILHEAYLQNFMSSDLRIREITQGTNIWDVIDRAARYDRVFLLHSVPRFNNPSGTFDNDQYLLDVITPDHTTFSDYLTAVFTECNVDCEEVEIYSTEPCTYDLPVTLAKGQ